MASFLVKMERKQKRSSSIPTLAKQVDHIVNRGIGGARSIWQCKKIQGLDSPRRVHDEYTYEANLTFERSGRKPITDPQRLSDEMSQIITYMKRAATTHGWILQKPIQDWQEPRLEENEGSKEKSEGDFIDFDKPLDYDEIDIPDVLVYGSDQEIESFPAFQQIYGRAPHIRIIAAAMRTMLLTKGKRRNHHVLHGLPGCGKSSLFHGFQQVVGKGGYVSINANSATRAGIEGLFLSRLRKIGGAPPFIFVEEIEKTQEQILTVWLSIMDDRAEVRKVQHRKLLHTQVRSLVFATANDKLLFDRMMGGRPGHPGALSSRMTGMYVPRPDWNVLKRILLRDIALYYPEAGNDGPLWAQKCIEIAQELETNDPRTVTCFLDGRTRLLDDDYRSDIMELHRLEKQDKRFQKGLEDFAMDEDDYTEYKRSF